MAKPDVISVIMGGGRGSRLQPLTTERCKPAVPLAGRYRLVDIPISNCLNSGYNKLFVLTQFNTASLHRHIQESYKFDPFGNGFVDILSAEQTQAGDDWYQGTADAVRRNLHHFSARDDDLILILSGDQLYQMDLTQLVEQHLATKSDITIAAKAMPLDAVAGLGLMRVQDDLRIEEFVEKPTDPAVIQGLAVGEKIQQTLSDPEGRDHVLANMGIYLFSFKTLKAALDNDFDDFGKEVIPGLLGKTNMFSFVFEGYWEDIGTVRAFFDANLALTDTVPPFNFFDPEWRVYTRARYLPPSKINGCQLNKVFMANGCIIDDASIERCVIGVRSRIGSGSKLENCIMMGADDVQLSEDLADDKSAGRPHIGVGKNCQIEGAIIDKNARIGDNVKLSPKGKPDMWRQGSIMVRDGVLVVLKGGVVESGTVV